MVAADSDEALMSAYRDGDAGAFGVLYARHRGGLYRFVLRQCGNRATADELFQDVWMNLIAARDRYLPTAKFSTYLYQVARNRIVDYFRARSRYPQMAEDEQEPVDPPAPPANQPERQVEAHRRAVRLIALIEALPFAQREAFLLHEDGGLTLEQIARVTGVGRETVKSRLRYALSRLREGMEEWL
ncbi:MAG TPA: RNA polymerase sigma factor [Burkholderiales bacterium]|nr:RNA polymerase sigma factor [Burkholderiales bacterium]